MMLDFSVFSIERIPLPLTSNLLPLLWHVTQLDNVNVSYILGTLEITSLLSRKKQGKK